MALGVVHTQRTVRDALLTGRVDDVLVTSPVYSGRGGGGVLLVPGTRHIATFPITTPALGEVVAQCKELADLVVIDTENNVLPMTAPALTADVLVFPAMLERASLEAAGTAMLVVDDVGGVDRIGGILFNQVPRDLPKGWARTLEFYRWGFGGQPEDGDLRGLGVAYTASIPESRLVRRIFSEEPVSGRLLEAGRQALCELLGQRASASMVGQYLADLRQMLGREAAETAETAVVQR